MLEVAGTSPKVFEPEFLGMPLQLSWFYTELERQELEALSLQGLAQIDVNYILLAMQLQNSGTKEGSLWQRA